MRRAAQVLLGGTAWPPNMHFVCLTQPDDLLSSCQVIMKAWTVSAQTARPAQALAGRHTHMHRARVKPAHPQTTWLALACNCTHMHQGATGDTNHSALPCRAAADRCCCSALVCMQDRAALTVPPKGASHESSHVNTMPAHAPAATGSTMRRNWNSDG
jgi:hypothetical protein